MTNERAEPCSEDTVAGRPALSTPHPIAVQNRAAEIRRRAERQAGQKLTELARSNGKQKNSVHRGPGFKEAIDRSVAGKSRVESAAMRARTP